MHTKSIFFIMCFATLVAPSTTWAAEVTVENVKIHCHARDICDFDVTLLHADSGWEHYANRFEILSPTGKVLGTRILHHPHVNEQPFTRSLTGIKIPKELNSVQVRGHDKVHGNGKAITVQLPERP